MFQPINQALMERVAGLQQEKWALEEKLVMLEQSGAAMADELVIKSELVMMFLVFQIHIRYLRCCNWYLAMSKTNRTSAPAELVPWLSLRKQSYFGKFFSESFE